MFLPVVCKITLNHILEAGRLSLPITQFYKIRPTHRFLWNFLWYDLTALIFFSFI